MHCCPRHECAATLYIAIGCSHFAAHGASVGFGPGGGGTLQPGLRRIGTPPPRRCLPHSALGISLRAPRQGALVAAKQPLTNSCRGHGPCPADGGGSVTVHRSARAPGRVTSLQFASRRVRRRHLAPAHDACPRPDTALQRLRHASPGPLGGVPCVLRGAERCASVHHSVLSPSRSARGAAPPP